MANDGAMKDRTPKPKDDRAERLAQALRTNLHRRKAQARAAQPSSEPPEEAGQ